MVDIPQSFRRFVAFSDSGHLDQSFFRVEYLPANKVKNSDRYQCRDLVNESGKVSGVDDNHVEAMVENITDKALSDEIFGSVDELPLVVNKGGSFEVVSGFHRVEALRRLNHETIPARVYSGGEGDEVEAALQFIAIMENDHKKSPLKLTKRDRMKTLRKMLENPLYQSMSSNQLAKISGISDKTITKIRKESGPEEYLDDEEVESGRTTKTKGVSKVKLLEILVSQLQAENAQLRGVLNNFKVRIGQAKFEGAQEIIDLIEEALRDLEQAADDEEEIIDITPNENEAPLLQLESPSDGKQNESLYVQILDLIETWNPASTKIKSLNDLTNKNWKRYQKSLSIEQIVEIKAKAKAKGLKTEERNRLSKAAPVLNGEAL